MAQKTNSVLVDKYRSMKQDMMYPHKLWAESLATALYIRSPTISAGFECNTPKDKLNWKPARVDHIHILGFHA